MGREQQPVHERLTVFYATKITMEVENCPRCGGRHTLSFSPLHKLIEGYDHFGLCPETNAPVLATIVFEGAFQDPKELERLEPFLQRILRIFSGKK